MASVDSIVDAIKKRKKVVIYICLLEIQYDEKRPQALLPTVQLLLNTIAELRIGEASSMTDNSRYASVDPGKSMW
jgi:hypothetical protein